MARKKKADDGASTGDLLARCLGSDAEARTTAAFAVVEQLEKAEPGKHGEELAPALARALADAGLSADDLARQLFLDGRASHEAWQEACRRKQTGDALFRRVSTAGIAAGELLKIVTPLAAGAVDVLAEGLRSGEQGTRMDASRAIARLGARAAPARDAMVQAIREHGIDHRPFGIATALGAIVAADRDDTTLDQLLDIEEGDCRFAACMALTEAGPAARRFAPKLRALLAQPQLMGAAADALAAIAPDDPSTLADILAAWPDVEGPPDARRGWFASAIGAAAAQDPRAALPVLLEIAADDEHAYRQGQCPAHRAATAAIDLLSTAPGDDSLTTVLREAHARWGRSWPDDLDAVAISRLGVPPRAATEDDEEPEPEPEPKPKAKRKPLPSLLKDLLGRKPDARSAAIAALEDLERDRRFAAIGKPSAVSFADELRAAVAKASLDPTVVADRCLRDLLALPPRPAEPPATAEEYESRRVAGRERSVLEELVGALASDVSDMDAVRAGLQLDDVRDASALILAAKPEHAAISSPILVEWLAAERYFDPMRPLALALAAAARSPDGQRTVEAVATLLASAEPEVRKNALATLQAMGPSARSALGRVLPLLEDDEVVVAAASAATAIAPEDEAVAIRIVGLWSTTDERRADWLRPQLTEAIAALRCRPDLVVPILAATIETSPYSSEADTALMALAGMGEAAAPAVPAIARALQANLVEGTILGTQYVMVAALGRLGGAASDAIPVLEWIERRLRKPPADARKAGFTWSTPPRQLVAAARAALAQIRPPA